MAYCSSSLPDIFAWISSLPPINTWKKPSLSTCLCSSSSSTHPSLNISVTKNSTSSFSLSVLADYNLPLVLWTSKPFHANPAPSKLVDDNTLSSLLINFVETVLSYSPKSKKIYMPKALPRLDAGNFKEIFNLAFLTLSFIICIYEAPADIRSSCLNTLRDKFACSESREAYKKLMRLLGTNTEEEWMRTVNLAVTNWMVELQALNTGIRTPSPLFSCSFSAMGMWKVELYCPVIAMDVENSNWNASADDRLLFSLNFHQLEGVIQLNYRVVVRDKWVEVMVNTDNIRFDIIRLVSETLMNERGAGPTEKHFPSRISLQLNPTIDANVLSVSVTKSSENPTTEIGQQRTIEGSFEPPNPVIGLKMSSGEVVTTSLKPWKFEQSVHANSAFLSWFLHDSVDGREVYSSKPSKISLLQPKAWFKNRYSSANRPFTRQGGVVFAGDEYGESVVWKLDKAAFGKSLQWEIKGWVWLTYWPNKHKTFYTETRRLEFREIINLNIC